jgi:hypothetical protein
MAQSGWRRQAAERILLEYLADIIDLYGGAATATLALSYARAKAELVDAQYTEEQAIRMLVRVAQLPTVSPVSA